MNVCFDVNTVVYLYSDAPEQANVLFAYDVANLRRFKVFVPACSLADINYVLHRCGLSGAKLEKAMGHLFEMFDVFDVIGQDGRRAATNPMRDFEDALIAESAARNGMDVILTYNCKDFAASPVQAMTPKQFMESFKPANIEYAEVRLAGNG